MTDGDGARYAAVDGPLQRLAVSNHGLRHSGGIERYALTLVGGLHALGLRPDFIAKTFDRSLPEYGWVRPHPAGVAWAPGKLRDLAFDWRIGRLKRRLGLGPLIACNQTRWADIAICGSTHPGYLAAMGRSAASAGWSDRLKIDLERRHLQRAAVVVAHSQRMADEAVQHYGLDPAKVRRLYPPVDAAQFHPVDEGARRALRARLGLPDERTVFLLASTGHARKGLALLADWFARTELPVTLAVAGRPVDAPTRNLVALGYRTDMPDVYRAADATVMASHYEPFGLVGVESVLCGTPVLVARGVGCAEVLPPPAGLGWSLDDPASLEAAVRSVLARRRDGTARLPLPRDVLGYDPDVAAHVRALLACAAEVSATAGAHARDDAADGPAADPEQDAAPRRSSASK